MPDTAAGGASGPRRPWVRMRTIFGESVLPPDVAATVVRAVNRAVAVGDVSRTARWQFLEWMAAEYLNGQSAAKAARSGRQTDPRPLTSAVSPVAAHDRLLALRSADVPDAERLELTDLIIDAVLESLGYEDAVHQLHLLRREAATTLS